MNPEREGVIGASAFSGILGRLIPSSVNLSLPKLGTEEILLIGAAAFLFFSREGDKECALLLLLLLLIN